MSHAPTTSFVVTCHNLGAYLPETLDSLFAQTDQDFDIVVVDDGSTDRETSRLLADLQSPRLRVVHTPRRGLPAARNLGVTHARGRFLCMVDADDLLEPSYLTRSLHELSSRREIAFASHWLRAFGDETWDWTPIDCTFPTLLHANTLNGAALMRREMFDAVGGFDESMDEGCEDWEFWIRTVAAGFRGVIIPEFLFRYRRRANSMSRAMQDVPGMPALVRQIVDRHPLLFAQYLPDLVARRDEEISSLSVSLWGLEEAWAGDVQGRLQWLSDNQRAHAAQLERDARQREQALEDQLQTERAGRAEDRVALSAAHAAVDGLGVHIENTRNEVRRLHAAFSRERHINDAIRSSWSWRLTAPLRAFAGRIRR